MNLFKILIVSAFIFFQSSSSFGQQIADSTFNFDNKNPIYKDRKGTVITLDEAHFNYHALSGRYYTFGRLLEQDGYNVTAGRSTFTSAYLSTIKILVIANALPDTSDWTLPAKSAFTTAEINELQKWVKSGGSLFDSRPHAFSWRILSFRSCFWL